MRWVPILWVRCLQNPVVADCRGAFPAFVNLLVMLFCYTCL
jgi:hypothetical protein